MKKIIIFGIGNSSDILEKYINYEKVEIVGYLDNDKAKIGSIISNKIVYSPNNLSNLEYDYILIAPRGIFHRKSIHTQLCELSIEQEKIIDIYDFINPVKLKIEKVNEFTEVLVSGLSYFQYGIDEELIDNCINLANESQDLYCDYNLLKYLLNNKKLRSINTVIIGLSYYSFQYDLSKSNCSKKMNLYYGLLDNFHNYQGDIAELLKQKKYIEDISKEIFKKEYEKISLNIPNGPITNQKIEAYKDLGYIDSNKNYPKTVKENEKIFKEYLELLYRNNIRIIITVAPTTKYYYEKFSQKLKGEFLEIIEKYQSEYKYEFYDFFESNEFNIDDFTDVSHLNNIGAKKYTLILNNYLKHYL